MSTTPPQASDAAYRRWADTLADHARGLPRKLVGERVETAFRELCTGLAPTLSVEVGAHEASFSVWMSQHVPSARCVAFEANPYVHQKFTAAIAGAGVEYVHLAVSQTRGATDLTIPRRMSDVIADRHRRKRRTNRMASIVGRHRYAERSEVVSVPSAPLDDVVDVAEDDVVVAWIDVEGSAGTVLPSGAAVLSRASLVHVEVETEPVWEGQWLDVDVARFLAGCDLVPVVRDVKRRHQYNVVFARPDIADDARTARLVDEVYRPRS